MFKKIKIFFQCLFVRIKPLKNYEHFIRCFGARRLPPLEPQDYEN